MLSTLGSRVVRPAVQVTRKFSSPCRVRFTARAAGGNDRDTAHPHHNQGVQVQPGVGLTRRPRTLATDLFFPGQVGSIFRDIEDEIARMWGNEGQQLMQKRVLGPVDIKETKIAYVFHMDAPGVTKENINVRITPDSILIISGERSKEGESSDDSAGFHRIERAYGKFQRRFALPDNIDASNIKAEVKHGELTVSVPKKEPVKQEHTEIPVTDATAPHSS